MNSERKFEIALLVLFFLFSWWLMGKSFSYDTQTHTFRIARHQVGDFGLHLSLVRSFSRGDNFPPQSPFFAGTNLAYHYALDLAVGLLEKIGVPIDLAMNGPSAAFFTALLYLIYKLPQVIFRKSKLLGIVSVLLFVFYSNFAFFEFLQRQGMSPALFGNWWYIQDYIQLSFFSLNPFLNQRHLIAGIAVSLLLVLLLLKRTKYYFAMGILLGFLSWIHTLIFFSTVIVMGLLAVFLKHQKIFRVIGLGLLVAGPRMLIIFDQIREAPKHPIMSIGQIIPEPGISFLLIPLGLILANRRQRLIFLSFFSLFLIANTFQLSFRIEHNHSLVNYFLIAANMYVAYALVRIWSKQTIGKMITVIALFFLTISGATDLLVIKNDFQFTVQDAPKDPTIQWIKTQTPPDSVFLAKQNTYDPVTLAGRKNYFGSTYYSEVTGSNVSSRRPFARELFEAKDASTLAKAREEGIDYLIIPNSEVADFPYTVDRPFLDANLSIAHRNNDVTVYLLQ